MEAIQVARNSGRVLVVDDEENICFSLKKILSDTGYEVFVAADAYMANSIIGCKDFDAALVDLLLAGGPDGLEVIAMLKRQNPNCQAILMSAYPTFSSAAKTLEYEAFAYLTKPIQKDEICSVVKMAVHKCAQKKELCRREAIFNSIFFTSPNPIIIYDYEKKIIFINPEFTRKFGYAGEEVFGRELFFVPVDDAGSIRSEFEQLLLGNTVPEREQKMIFKNGENLSTTRLVSLAYCDSLETASIVVIIRDITEVKKMEQQLVHSEKMSVLGQLGARISHEINNPLFSIIGHTELLKRKNLDPETQKYLSTITEAANSVSRLNNDILSLSRPPMEEISTFAPEAPLEKAIEFLKNVGQIKYFEIVKDYEPDMPYLTGDTNQLHQAFMNLIMNASHAMKDSVQKTLLFKIAYDKVHGLAHIAVSDTGCGIPRENLEAVLNPFFTTKADSGGTGLGLSVVKSIVERHKGILRIESMPGNGTTVTVCLPLAASSRVN